VHKWGPADAATNDRSIFQRIVMKLLPELGEQGIAGARNRRADAEPVFTPVAKGATLYERRAKEALLSPQTQ
jgi:hypothetical protein